MPQKYEPNLANGRADKYLSALYAGSNTPQAEGSTAKSKTRTPSDTGSSQDQRGPEYLLPAQDSQSSREARRQTGDVRIVFRLADVPQHRAEQSKPVRPSGPVKLFELVVRAWELTDKDAATLLGFDDAQTVRDIWVGRRSVGQRDANDRLRAVLRIAADLDALYRDPAVIRAWLDHPQVKLGGKTPKAELLEGSMERLLIVKHYVAALSGR